MLTGAVESIPSSEVSVTVPGSIPAQFTSLDIGSVGAAGSASACSGQYTIMGSGADIWYTADAFQYVYVPITTNCDIRARVVNLQSTQSNAKGAVMIRESLTAGSRHATVDITPGAGIEFLWRTNTGSATTSASITGAAPNWVRLTRTNNTFTAYWSADGVAWAQFGSATITMSANAYAGLAVCSHAAGNLCTVVMDNVSISSLSTKPVAPHNLHIVLSN